MNQFSLLIVPPYHPHLPVLLFYQMRHPLPHQPLRCPAPPVKTPPADRENAVVGFQHIVTGTAHDGFCQFRSNKAVHAHADLVYFFFIACGTTILHFLGNLFFPIFVIVRLLIVNFFNFLHLVNTFLPICVIVNL